MRYYRKLTPQPGEEDRFLRSFGSYIDQSVVSEGSAGGFFLFLCEEPDTACR